MGKMMQPADGKATKILARSFYRELRENGYSCNQILALSTELIDLVTRELKSEADHEVPTPEGSREQDWRQAL